MIKRFIICTMVWLLPSCSTFKAPDNLQAVDQSGFIKINSCLKFEQEEVDVFYKRYKPERGVYKGDIAFSFRPEQLIQAQKVDGCSVNKNVLLEEVLNNTVTDTGRFKIQITLKLKTDAGTFTGRGESQFYNSFGDFSGNKTQQARIEALEAALKLAILGLDNS
ncbi:hypothetical protein [Kangiella aquimarina]|uniref:Lipoprotein n=1 Tax=Kangiella aquimarina TaxID=261965 RepID=A0ABZ0X445_9GAMM|nr:hypothetical protein [Kangiella aquimarina]WQG85371.1 hypothetical protein SR900_00475 [Kangiella aquimarina]